MLNKRLNIYAVGQNTSNEGVIVPIQVNMPADIQCTSPLLHFFATSRDALRFYNGTFSTTRAAHAVGGTCTDVNNRNNQRAKRERLLKEATQKRRAALAAATVCRHDKPCTCYRRWRESVLADVSCPIEEFRRRRHHQGELRYAAFVNCSAGTTRVTTTVLTFKAFWTKIRPGDKQVFVRFCERNAASEAVTASLGISQTNR